MIGCFLEVSSIVLCCTSGTIVLCPAVVCFVVHLGLIMTAQCGIRYIGNCGLKVTNICLGAMTFGERKVN